MAARLEERGVVAFYRIAGRGPRKARHLYLTIHDGEAVIASRTVHAAPRAGEEALVLGRSGSGCVVTASAFNRLRQRSNLTSTGALP